MFTGKDEYGLLVGQGVEAGRLIANLDEVVGKDAYALYPGSFIPGFEWGVALQGWTQQAVSDFADVLRDRFNVPVEPDWSLSEA